MRKHAFAGRNTQQALVELAILNEPPKNSLFQEQKCPLKIEPDTYENSDKFLTILEKGTLFIPSNKFSTFSKSIFISIILSADDSKCHLPTIDRSATTTLSESSKIISIKLDIDEHMLKELLGRFLVPGLAFLLFLIILALFLLP